MGNDDYPPKNFKGSGFWKFKAPKAEKKEPADDGPKKEEPEKPVECKLRDGHKPWPMCEQGSLPVNGMNGDLINRVVDGPFLDKPKNSTKAASGKEASGASPKAAV